MIFYIYFFNSVFTVSYIYYLMNKILISVVFLALLVCTYQSQINSNLNIKYSDMMHGKSAIDEKIIRKIYDEEFHSSYFEKSQYRYHIFLSNLKKIINHNKGNHSWKQGITAFTDFTFEQFKKMKLMAPQECNATHNLQVSKQFKATSLPPSYQWNDFNMITPVKDQGNCGSCWAFSTVAAIEAYWNILSKGRDLTFSQQQLVDCAGNFNNYGCDGGLPSQAFQYIKYAGGIQKGITYPYYATDMACVFRRNIAVGYVKYGAYNITKNDQTELAQRLYNHGPISVAFDVTDEFVHYISGVYSQQDCGKTTDDVNHAVLATGYGIEGGKKYWNIKNSWSTDWGNKGYFKIQKDVNMCAIAQCNSYPLIDDMSGLEEVGKVQVQ